MKTWSLTLIALLLISADVEAQALRWFPPTPVFQSYLWESMSTTGTLEFQYQSQAPEQYPWADDWSRHPLVEIGLGLELPLIGGLSGDWRWYVGAPVAVTILEDFFQTDSAPVVNVDYWFGIRAEILWETSWRWPETIGLRILPLYHESTHIGDELAFRMTAENPEDFYRINISYEAWEITLGLDEWIEGRNNALTLRLGVRGLWNDDGYYSQPDPSEIGSNLNVGDIHPSRGRGEFFGQIGWIRLQGFPALGKWSFRMGIEALSRIRLDYFTTIQEHRVWSVNGTMAWRRPLDRQSGRSIGVFLRLYSGQIPYGMFRESDGLFLLGCGVVLGL